MIPLPHLDVREFRTCIQAMSDQQLVGLGRACQSLSRHRNSRGERSREAIYKNQLQECCQEWSLRHPKRA